LVAVGASDRPGLFGAAPLLLALSGVLVGGLGGRGSGGRVIRFWILDFGFWIYSTILYFGFWIYHLVLDRESIAGEGGDTFKIILPTVDSYSLRQSISCGSGLMNAEKRLTRVNAQQPSYANEY
jgi:hypothetical protein